MAAFGGSTETSEDAIARRVLQAASAFLDPGRLLHTEQRGNLGSQASRAIDRNPVLTAAQSMGCLLGGGSGEIDLRTVHVMLVQRLKLRAMLFDDGNSDELNHNSAS
jgi:hypothetical protein